jgi:hypothetical protein
MARLPDPLSTLSPDARRVYDKITAKRNEIPKDYLTRVKMTYLDEGAAPSHRWYGWVTG